MFQNVRNFLDDNIVVQGVESRIKKVVLIGTGACNRTNTVFQVLS